MAILGVMLINFFITVAATENPDVGNSFYKVINMFTMAIVIVVVAVPEGLPLSIGICLAYSTKTMKENKILVKRLEATEVMGSVEEIVTGKTGTLTTGEMNVAEWWASGDVV